MKIENITLKNKLILAPMEGVTFLPFRLLCKKYGASLTFTEMIDITSFLKKDKTSIKRFDTCDEERPVGIQLLGKNTDSLKKIIKVVGDKYDFIDFNFGCPLPEIVNQGKGAALLENPEKIKAIIKTLVNNTDKPIIAKIRLREEKEKTLEIAKIIEENGASTITVHARTPSQGYGGKIHGGNTYWEYIKEIKANLNIPVIGNGGVENKKDYDKILKETNCDAVMIGRAAIFDPSIFHKILCKKTPNKTKIAEEFLMLCREYGYKGERVEKEYKRILQKEER